MVPTACSPVARPNAVFGQAEVLLLVSHENVAHSSPDLSIKGMGGGVTRRGLDGLTGPAVRGVKILGLVYEITGT